ncbi:MAG TPA: FAD-dependent thymidylate synthase [Candidatus Krumholzibacteria bacterium]|nr:FAD-dependent thymidylate synthase [Candidatus Krumholzibacteria bacterium]
MSESTDRAERVERPRVAALDEILGEALPVLDDGFVRVVDYMGDDGSIVQAARVSYGKGTKKVSEDRGLIRYLLRHRHTTPFEMAEIKLHVRVPMDCWRQWIRHRTANVNEYSTRYSIAIEASQTTAPDEWRQQAASNRQGSEGFADHGLGETLSAQERELQDHARRVYNERLERGIAREQARKDLPLSTYTEAYWKVDLHNLLHFLALRMDMHAQEEIREYATVIGERIASKWVPLTWEAFEDYRRGGAFFSRIDREILRLVVQGDRDAATRRAEELGILSWGEKGPKRNRERAELETKLADLGLAVPWADRSGPS